MIGNITEKVILETTEGIVERNQNRGPLFLSLWVVVFSPFFALCICGFEFYKCLLLIIEKGECASLLVFQNSHAEMTIFMHFMQGSRLSALHINYNLQSF